MQSGAVSDNTDVVTEVVIEETERASTVVAAVVGADGFVRAAVTGVVEGDVTIGNEAGTEIAKVVAGEKVSEVDEAGAGVGLGVELKTKLASGTKVDEVSPERARRSDHRKGSRERRSESVILEGTSLPVRSRSKSSPELIRQIFGEAGGVDEKADEEERPQARKCAASPRVEQ